MKKVILIVLLFVSTFGLAGCPWFHHHGYHHVDTIATTVQDEGRYTSQLLFSRYYEEARGSLAFRLLEIPSNQNKLPKDGLNRVK
jgi:hypothetical protein